MPKISKYFTLEEMLFSQTATRAGIDNTPTSTQIFYLTRLCIGLLDNLRISIGRPIHVSSGFRCAELNAMIGGASNSQHVEGKAADISVPGWTTEQLYQFVKHSGLQFDQCIQEFSQWVHISYSPDTGNRQQCLRAVKQDGKTQYLPD